MKEVDIYTDGACSGNPGAGGWAAVLFYNGRRKEISGFEPETTNNRMELLAVIQGISSLKEPCSVTVYSDSSYAVDAFNKGWVNKWRQNDWKTADKGEVKNRDLWNNLLTAIDGHRVKFVKVKGHADNEHNNRCDELARAAIKSRSDA
ncbi:MAG: ribonuclease HI [Clostridiales bacterium]|jgi:ribonuclease HI|nr:ribonuclease HI [Clostridiales bacterium]